MSTSATWQQRFSGISRLYGQAGSTVIANAHIAVVGLGGVGTWAAEALARSGVGQLTLIDLDDICVTNINRQLHALSETVGQSKIEVMKRRILAINPDCQVNLIDDFIDSANCVEFLGNNLNGVIDAVDNVRAKAAMIAHCKRQKLPIIVCGSAGGQVDPSQIGSADLARTYNDPLLAKTRNLLRREYNFSRNTKRRFSVETVYSTEQLIYPQPDGSVCSQKSLHEGEVRLDCSGGFGAATMVTGTFGFIAAARLLNKLTGKKPS